MRPAQTVDRQGSSRLILVTIALMLAQLAIAVGDADAQSRDRSILRRVTVSGNALFRAEIREGLSRLEGVPYSEDELRTELGRLMGIYYDAGYAFARVMELVPRVLDDGYYVGVTVDEGRIGSIVIHGLRKTREDVIRRQLMLQQGMIYHAEDAVESERILRSRSYLGDVHIAASADPNTNAVTIEVWVDDLWSFVPRFRVVDANDSSLSDLLDGDIGFQATVADSNVFGSGQAWVAGYRWDTTGVVSDGSVTSGGRGRISLAMVDPNAFQSRWQMEARYAQLTRTDRESWELRLSHPFYSLRTRWGFDFRAVESAVFDRVREGEVLVREWERHFKAQYAEATRSVGAPQNQLRLSFWAYHRDTDHVLRFSAVPTVKGSTVWASARGEDRLRFSPSSVPLHSEYLAGIDATWRRVEYVQERNVNRLGRIEDIGIGTAVTASLGGGARVAANIRDELRPALRGAFAYRQPSGLLWDGDASVSSSYVVAGDFGTPTGHENTIVRAQSRVFLRRQASHAVVARLEATLGSRTTDDFSLVLDDLRGVRGYGRDTFGGTRRAVANLEARRTLLTWLGVLVQTVAFYDHGYIWSRGLRLDDPKRSAGVGVRFAFLRFAESPIVRVDGVYRFDASDEGWAWSIGTGQQF
ncbi:hypothetical protein FJZ36_07965 [Candidatus Poribacteria bacterium]|nr:hypothetical protein [Candidatus Poribacteria bacterium]